MVLKEQCKKCGLNKPITDFFKGETCIEGFYETCKSCRTNLSVLEQKSFFDDRNIGKNSSKIL